MTGGMDVVPIVVEFGVAGAYLGLVPTEYSSGTSRSQGSITKTGNGHARRLLIEAAWHHRQPVSPRRGSAAPLGCRQPGSTGSGQLD